MTYDPNADLKRDFTAASEPAFSNHSHEPNAETIAAMEAARRGEGLVTVDGIDGLMAYLHADDEGLSPQTL